MSPSATARKTWNHSSADCLLTASGGGIKAAVIVGGANIIMGIIMGGFVGGLLRGVDPLFEGIDPSPDATPDFVSSSGLVILLGEGRIR